MKPLFTGEELQALGQIDARLERLPLSAGEWMEAEARDRAIQREERGARHKDRPGRGLAALEAGWFERARAVRFPTTEAAARACGVSPKLMWILECGGVTAPELARRVGRAMELTGEEVRALTCAGTWARRKREAAAPREDARRFPRGA